MTVELQPSGSVGDKNWVLDSGATHHLIGDQAMDVNVTPFNGSEGVTIGNRPDSISNK